MYKREFPVNEFNTVHLIRFIIHLLLATGIPATLNYIDLNETAAGHNVQLKPYRGTIHLLSSPNSSSLT